MKYLSSGSTYILTLILLSYTHLVAPYDQGNNHLPKYIPVINEIIHKRIAIAKSNNPVATKHKDEKFFFNKTEYDSLLKEIISQLEEISPNDDVSHSKVL